jgi:hypothetical protein
MKVLHAEIGTEKCIPFYTFDDRANHEYVLSLIPRESGRLGEKTTKLIVKKEKIIEVPITSTAFDCTDIIQLRGVVAALKAKQRPVVAIGGSDTVLSVLKELGLSFVIESILNVDMLDIMYPSSLFTRFAPIFLDDLSPSDLRLFYLNKIFVMGRSTVFLRGISPHTEADLKERTVRFRANLSYWESVLRSKASNEGEAISSILYSEGSFCIRIDNAVTCISTLCVYQVDWAVSELVNKLRIARAACIVPIAIIAVVAQAVDDQVPHQLVSYPNSQDTGYLEYSTTFAMGFPRPLQLIGEDRKKELSCALAKCDVCEDVSNVLIRHFDLVLKANASTTIRHHKRETRSSPQILRLMDSLAYSKQCSFGSGFIMCVQKTRARISRRCGLEFISSPYT